MISPLPETQCSASYGVKSGGTSPSPPADNESSASSNAADPSPSKDGGGALKGSSPPLPYCKRVGCSEGLSLSIPESNMAVGMNVARQKRQIVAAVALAQTLIAFLT
jgi:hypothetical protein